MKRKILFLGLLLPGLCSPQRASASFVALSLDASSRFKDGLVLAQVRVVNHGDEPAGLVWTEAGVAGFSARGATLPSLPPDGTNSVTLDLGAAPPTPGIYMVQARVHFTDAGCKPLSAVACIPLHTAVPPSGDDAVRAALAPVTLRGHGLARLSLTNATGAPIAADIRLVLPEEIEGPPATRHVTLPPRGSIVETFRISNLSADPGRSCTVIALVDYLEGGQHRSVATQTRLAAEFPTLPLVHNPAAAATVSMLLLLAAFLMNTRIGRRAALLRPLPPWAHTAFDLSVLALLCGFILSNLTPSLLLTDTLTTGGDTPAHSYLASHLRASLFGEGRISSWASGWWCGFPMFQYYFCLPYLLVALLSVPLKFNVAFKLVTVAGSLLLPPAAYVAGRTARLPRPAPLLLAIVTLPLLFDDSHTMWGVNLYSTLAGMISNSLSFPIMLLVLACAWRDADDGRFRIRTVLLMTALVASHFFTSLLAAIAVACMPFAGPRAGLRRALGTLAREGALAALLMAWWLIPLLATRECAVDFGGNWDVNLLRQFSPYAVCLAPFILPAAAAARSHAYRFAVPLLCLLSAAAVLFVAGHDWVSAVFVNVRLWPFILFGVLALGAIGTAAALRGSFRPLPAAAAFLLLTLAFGVPWPNNVAGWSGWNYSGIERKPGWPAFRDLVLPLKGISGRLANDLHPDYNTMGSSRIIECVPHLIGKPILEGGILNSAWGSLFAYYIQGETSDAAAGFPTKVEPAAFDITNATKHLDLFNVRHFIARSPRTRAALAAHPAWHRLRESDGWELFELTSHDGRYVFIPEYWPIAVPCGDRQAAGLDWIYTIGSLDQFFVLLRPREDAAAEVGPVLAEADYRRHLESCSQGRPSPLARRRTAAPPDAITGESVTDSEIRFRTTATNMPHVVKCTWFPNWQAADGSPVYMVTPCFLVVYPRHAEVQLYYGRTLPDNIACGLTGAGLCILLGLSLRRATARWQRRCGGFSIEERPLNDSEEGSSKQVE